VRLARRILFTRSLQVGFLVLLAVTSAQLAWWIVDEVRYTRDVRDQLRNAHLADTAPARELLRSGRRWTDIARLYPALVISPDSGTITVSPAVLSELDDHRFHRLNRYGWEGAFFFAVLVAAMAVVYRALREEAELRRRQEQFLAAVSHEFKSPLSSLRLSVETLAMRDPPSAQRAELVRRLLVELGRLERMIGNTLDVSRLSAAEIRRSSERLALADEVAAAVEDLRGVAQESEVTVLVDVPATVAVRADRERMRTVLRNLVHNAIKASANGGTVRVQAAASSGRVRLEVRDHGIGFPSAEAPRLFEKFYRVEGEGRGRMQGTGLGLYLVRRNSELDGGTASAASEGLGHGAVFTVTWPDAGDATA